MRGRGGNVELTRDGNLGVDSEGYLETAGGQLLQPPVSCRRGPTKAKSRSPPTAPSASAAAKSARSRSSPSPTPTGSKPPAKTSSARPPPAAPSAPPTGTTVQQGALESSNVDMGQTTVEMMNAQRGYELNSRVIQTQDEVLAVANGIKR